MHRRLDCGGVRMPNTFSSLPSAGKSAELQSACLLLLLLRASQFSFAILSSYRLILNSTRRSALSDFRKLGPCRGVAVLHQRTYTTPLQASRSLDRCSRSHAHRHDYYASQSNTVGMAHECGKLDVGFDQVCHNQSDGVLGECGVENIVPISHASPTLQQIALPYCDMSASRPRMMRNRVAFPACCRHPRGLG